jgi:hypothetical protein
MQGEAWTAIGVAAAAALTAAGATAASYLATRAQSNRVEAKVDTAATVAEQAANNTQHVSNGFASKTTTGIDRLLEGQDRMQAALERLAESHGRTVGRVDHLTQRLDKHLDPPGHGTSGTTTEGGA